MLDSFLFSKGDGPYASLSPSPVPSYARVMAPSFELALSRSSRRMFKIVQLRTDSQLKLAAEHISEEHTRPNSCFLV